MAEAPQRYQALKEAEAGIRPIQETLADLEKEIGSLQETSVPSGAQHEAAKEALAQLEGGRRHRSGGERAL
jgi:hypothetical protein